MEKLKFFVEDKGYSEKVKNYTPLFKNLIEGNFSENIKLVNEIKEADYLSLPYHFAKYHFSKTVHEVEKWARIAKDRNKKLLVWHKGDLDPVEIDNVIFFQNAYYSYKNDKSKIVVPYFIEDPYVKLLESSFTPMEKEELPSVGFCGYAKQNIIKELYSYYGNLRTIIKKKYFGYDYYPNKFIPYTKIRNKVMNLLDNHPEIKTNFILRSKGTAGIGSISNIQKPQQTVFEFYNNMLTNNYTVCVRGYGNFSVRFFETLACGRIPVFVDTDCVLPFEDLIDYKKLCVWVPQKDLKYTADIILEFHKSFDNQEFKEHQKECRRVWQMYLSEPGFFNHITKVL